MSYLIFIWKNRISNMHLASIRCIGKNFKYHYRNQVILESLVWASFLCMLKRNAINTTREKNTSCLSLRNVIQSHWAVIPLTEKKPLKMRKKNNNFYQFMISNKLLCNRIWFSVVSFLLFRLGLYGLYSHIC